MIIYHISTALQEDPPDTNVEDAEGSLEDYSGKMTDGDEPNDQMSLG